jgi:hypothetical protein
MSSKGQKGVVQNKVLGVANFVPNITHLVIQVSLLTHYSFLIVVIYTISTRWISNMYHWLKYLSIFMMRSGLKP